MRVPRRGDDGRVVQAALVVGYLALAAAVVASYRSPAAGYELSIYAGTPAATWAALAVVAAVSVSVSLFDDRYLPLAVLLGGLGAATVAGLPLIRGYYFLGRADSLVHLGLTRSMAINDDPLRLFYPGSHLVAASLSAVAGVGIPRAMMLVTWLYTLLFFAGVSLCVWFLVPDRRALAVGAFSAFLLLPINNVSTHLHFHTYSIGMLFVPFAIYLVFAHLLGGDTRVRAASFAVDGGTVGSGSFGIGTATDTGVGSRRTVPTSYLLPLVSVALVLVHPQVALNVAFLLVGMVVTQHAYRRFRPNAPIAEYRLLTVQMTILVVAFAIWIATHDWQFFSTAEAMIESVSEFITGTGETTPRVESQGDSVVAIGGSISDLFVKLFGVATVYALLAAAVVLGRVSGYLGRPAAGRSMRTTTDTSRYVMALLFAGVAAILPFFAVHFVGSISTYLFRHVGFLMTLATIFGAVGVRYLLGGDPSVDGRGGQSTSGRLRTVRDRLDAIGPTPGSVATVAVVLVVLSLSLATAFPSPFIYLSGSHVSEGEMDGYERSFASQPDGSPVWFGGVRTTSERYEGALYGAEGAPWERAVTPPPKKSGPAPEQAMLDGLPAYYGNHPEEIVRRDHYFVIAEADHKREVTAYGELRYSAASFEAVGSQPDVGKIRDNGELTVYFVDVPDEPVANGTDDGTGTAG